MLDVMKSRDDLLVIQDGFDYSIFVESFNCESGEWENTSKSNKSFKVAFRNY